MVNAAFAHDPRLLEALDKACTLIVNKPYGNPPVSVWCCRTRVWPRFGSKAFTGPLPLAGGGTAGQSVRRYAKKILPNAHRRRSGSAAFGPGAVATHGVACARHRSGSAHVALPACRPANCGRLLSFATCRTRTCFRSFIPRCWPNV